jgi:carbamoyl-phosphate synthase large subunit
MPKNLNINSILVLGSGPIIIGQACEFDYSGTQAIRSLKELGYRVVLLNSNPATIMTDPEFSDSVYLEPLNLNSVEKILKKEKIDAILPTMGGQTALNLAVKACEAGLLEKYNVKLIGANLKSIKLSEDRQLFKETISQIGLESAKSKIVTNIEEGAKALEEIGLPLILRPSFTLGGEGGGVAYTKEEYFKILERGLFLSPTHTVLVEESLLGWKEFELEVVRDLHDNVIIVCTIENLDPMGIHTGDSITVAPAQTLTDRQFQILREQAKKIIRTIGVETGGCNIQFAVNPKNGRVVVIEMNPRVSRSSALASKATGFPIAKIATKLSVGFTLDELKNEITTTTPASFEPSLDYVITKIPRFDFEKFTTADPILSTQMKSVGEVMGIGRTFKESLLKALASIENKRPYFKPTEFDDENVSLELLQENLKKPKWNRLWIIASAIRRGLTINEIHSLTQIDPWFLQNIFEIISFESQIKKDPDVKNWSTQFFKEVKKIGFTDFSISQMTNTPLKEVIKERENKKLEPSFEMIDTCAGEFESKTPYFYSTYLAQSFNFNSHHSTNKNLNNSEKKSVLVLGGGPNRIGQGIEFDYCCVHACLASKEMGINSIMINCNPETVSTDYDISSQLYFEPVSVEHVYEIFKKEKNALGAIVQFGGQTPLKIAKTLSELNIPILGTSIESIDLAEDRKKFENLCLELKSYGINLIPSKTATSKNEALLAAKELGYPILIRPSYVLGGQGMRIIYSEKTLHEIIDQTLEISEDKPILIDRFLSDAIEVDVDCISDGHTPLICGILEHIEEAGIHSGDSACSLPSFTLGQSTLDRLREITKILALKLKVIGFLNVQFAIKDQQIYILEANPRASRTIPFISKAIQKPLPKIATQIILGKKLKDLGFEHDFDLNLKNFNVKMPVFPFDRFIGTDPLLGPEMKSTGEVIGQGENFPQAFAKALEAANINLPKSGVAFLSVHDLDKPAIIDVANALILLGFRLEATEGTAQFLKKNGIPVETVAKYGEGENHCLTKIKNSYYQFIINTTKSEKAFHDSMAIRRTALEKKIPYCTLVTTARAFVRAIQASKNTKP